MSLPKNIPVLVHYYINNISFDSEEPVEHEEKKHNNSGELSIGLSLEKMKILHRLQTCSFNKTTPIITLPQKFLLKLQAFSDLKKNALRKKEKEWLPFKVWQLSIACSVAMLVLLRHHLLSVLRCYPWLWWKTLLNKREKSKRNYLLKRVHNPIIITCNAKNNIE